MDSHVKRIEVGWDDTKDKAQARLQLLQNTKAAWEGYAEGLESIVVEFEKAEEEMKKVKKRFNLQAAFEDLEKRQKIFNDSKNTIETMFANIQNNYEVMTMTLPEDKKDFVKKEVKAIQEKLEVVGRFEEKVKKIDDFCASLNSFDKTIKVIDNWMRDADQQLNHIKNESDKMTPEDRVSYTMELQEDVAAKVETIKKAIATEAELLPQGTFSKHIFFNMIVPNFIKIIFTFLPSTYITPRRDLAISKNHYIFNKYINTLLRTIFFCSGQLLKYEHIFIVNLI